MLQYFLLTAVSKKNDKKLKLKAFRNKQPKLENSHKVSKKVALLLSFFQFFKLGRKYKENKANLVFQSKYFIFECKNFDFYGKPPTFELFLIYFI